MATNDQVKAKASGLQRLRYYLIGLVIMLVLHVIHWMAVYMFQKDKSALTTQYYSANFLFLFANESWIIRFPISFFNRVIIPFLDWLFPVKTGLHGASTQWILGQKISDDDPELQRILRNATFWIGLFLGVCLYFLIPSEVNEFSIAGKGIVTYSLLSDILTQGRSFHVVLENSRWILPLWHAFLCGAVIFVAMDFMGLFATVTDVGRRAIKPYLEQVRNVRYLFTPLPPCPFDPKSDEFELSYATVKRDGKEEWFVFAEEANCTSKLTFGEPGSGKTQGFIIPDLRQSILWQAGNHAKKAAGIVFDPKQELTKKAIGLLKEAGREKDIIHLNIGASNPINPILVKDPLKLTNIELGVSYVLSAWITTQGASTSDPYWTVTAQLMITLAYTISVAENAGWVSLSVLYEIANEMSSGLRSVTGTEKRSTINRKFAERWYGIEIAITPLLDLETIVPLLSEDEQDEMASFLDCLIERGERVRAYLSTMNADEVEDAGLIIQRNLSTYTSLYENIPVENRNQAITNIIPFLRIFTNPHIERALCGKELFVLEDLLEKDGKWIILDVPQSLGAQVVRAITVLIKYRFQKAVLEVGRQATENGNKPRVKVMFLEEAQKLLTVGSAQQSAEGDAEFYDLCRSSRCSSMVVTQGIDSFFNAAGGNRDGVNTVLANIRGKFGIGVQAPGTKGYLSDVFGKVVRTRQSKNFSENSSGVAFDTQHEEYASASDSLSVSFGISEQLEDMFGKESYGESEKHTAVGIIFDRTLNRHCAHTFYLRPDYWPHKTDRYELLLASRFDLKRRNVLFEKFEKDMSFQWQWRVLSFLGADDFHSLPNTTSGDSRTGNRLSFNESR